MSDPRRGRRSKYAAIATMTAGVRFASRREAARYLELTYLSRAGMIRDLELQPVYPLHAIDLTTGEITRVGEYRADFRYRVTATDAIVVEDVKGMATLPLARWKQKHCRGEYGVIVQEHR